MYNFTIEKNGVSIECSLLTVVPNTSDYVALFLNESNQTVKSNFPFWLFIQTDNDKYFIPGLSFIVANPQLGLERYIGYALREKTLSIPSQENYAFNPFMPEQVTDPIKTLLEG